MFNRSFDHPIRNFFLLFPLALLLGASTAFAQGTAFTYQGKLTDGGTPANGNYDLQFALWDSAAGGTRIGSTQTVNTVAVSAGIFTVTLDFGVNAFPGTNRFLEIAVRPSGGGSFTTLSPRQQIGSTPYAIRTLSAGAADGLSNACVGCVQDAQINSVAGSKVNGAIPVASVPAGSGNYIQNTTSAQGGANFNISGNGTAGGTLSSNVVNATTQYNIGGSPVLSVPGDNTFAGLSAGAANTTGFSSAFFGRNAGTANTEGFDNAFFGGATGLFNTTGFSNSFFGYIAGRKNTMGFNNAFFGDAAGSNNTTGTNNTIVGAFANVGSDNLDHATAIGAGSSVSANNTIALGRSGGQDTVLAYGNVGIGPTTPAYPLSVMGAAGSGQSQGAVEFANGVTDTGVRINNLSSGGRTYTLFSSGAGSALGAGTFHIYDATAGADRLTIDSSGNVYVPVLGAGGTNLCHNASQITDCSSSLRYKKDLLPFTGGLDLLKRLQPITFTWKDHPERDLGLAAEEVAEVEPLLVTHNAKGQIEGVKYDRLTAVLVSAIKEQQAQVKNQQEQIQQQQAQINQQQASAKREQGQLRQQQLEIEALKKLVCRHHRNARVCR